MPIHRGPRLDDLVSRLAYRAMPIAANVYKTWPNLATGLTVASAVPPGGAWVEFISAANAPTQPFTVIVSANNSAGSFIGVFEIGIGGAGAEVAVASGHIPVIGGYAHPHPMPIIPGGTRVAMRVVEGTNGNPSFKLISALLPPSLDPFSALRLAIKRGKFYPGQTTLLNLDTGSPAVTGGTAWTYGAYKEMWSAAVEPNPVIICAIGSVSHSSFSGPYQTAYATGSAGSEVVFAELPVGPSAISIGQQLELPVPLIVPGGTRFAWKAAGNSASMNIYMGGFSVVRQATYP